MQTDSSGNLQALSQALLYAARTGEDSRPLQQQLGQSTPDNLKSQLTDDAGKKAFWLNVYNAYVQLLLKENPDRYKKRGQFFGDKAIPVAGQKLSLDYIEHGLLRRSKIKWSLGHLNKLFPGRLEKQLRVLQSDYRIHFALNCGAKSCPPIAYYDKEKIDRQLDLATRTYLKSEANYDAEKNIVYLPAIMSWFRRDFGGKKQMKKLLRELKIIPEEANPSIRFKKYDWSLFLSNYKNETDE